MAQDTEREQWARVSDEHRTDFAKAKNPLPKRVAACLLWVVSALIEVAVGAIVAGVVEMPVLGNVWGVWVAIAVVCCAVLTVAAQRLWKAAGALKAVKAQTEVGVAMACLGFVGWAVFFLLSKNLSAKVKVLGVAAGVVPLLASAAIANLL